MKAETLRAQISCAVAKHRSTSSYSLVFAFIHTVHQDLHSDKNYRRTRYAINFVRKFVATVLSLDPTSRLPSAQLGQSTLPNGL